MVRGGTALALATSVIRAPLLVAIVLTACSPGLPRPKTGPVPKDAMFEIPYPPPAARVETIPAKKSEADVWIDGQWDWDGRDFRWQPGTWMKPPAADAYFTRWRAERRRDGRLYFARAAWRDKRGRPLAAWPSLEVCPKDDGETASR